MTTHSFIIKKEYTFNSIIVTHKKENTFNYIIVTHPNIYTNKNHHNNIRNHC